MIANILSNVRIDQLEAAKWSFVLLYVVCTAGVVIGVYWEGHKFPVAKQQLGWKLLIISLATEMLMGILIFAADGWISELQRTEIASLQRQVRGRELSAQQVSLVISALRDQKTNDFTVIVGPDLEAGRFALSIWQLLKAAGVATEMKFLEKEPESIMLTVGAMACEDDTPESDRVIKALWGAGVVDQYWPIRPLLGVPNDATTYRPSFCPPNSVFVGKRAPPQEVWLPRIQ